MDKQKTKTITSIIIVVVMLVLIIYDIIIAVGGGTTISEVVWGVCTKRPFIPFLSGFLCGHLFWQKGE